MSEQYMFMLSLSYEIFDVTDDGDYQTAKIRDGSDIIFITAGIGGQVQV